MAAPYKEASGKGGCGVELSIKLTPNAARDEIGRLETVSTAFGEIQVLTLRVRAMPVKGAANAAALKLIAKWLDVPKSSLSLVQGGQSRIKRVLIEGKAGDITAQLEGAFSALKTS